MTGAPVPDPKAKPISSDELAKDAGFPDDGPLEDNGPAEIDIEREAAGVMDDEKSDGPPITTLPPD